MVSYCKDWKIRTNPKPQELLLLINDKMSWTNLSISCLKKIKKNLWGFWEGEGWGVKTCTSSQQLQIRVKNANSRASRRSRHHSIIVKQIVGWRLQARACPPSSLCNQSLLIVLPPARTSSISPSITSTCHSSPERTGAHACHPVGNYWKDDVKHMRKDLWKVYWVAPSANQTYEKSTKSLCKARQQRELYISFFSLFPSIFVFIWRSEQTRHSLPLTYSSGGSDGFAKAATSLIIPPSHETQTHQTSAVPWQQSALRLISEYFSPKGRLQVCGTLLITDWLAVARRSVLG